MHEECLIEVLSSFEDENDRREYKITTGAQFEGQDDDYTIRYSDTDEDMNTCTTVLHVRNGDMIHINRAGDISSDIVLERDKRHISMHDTPFGALNMGILTQDIRSAIHDGNGTLYFKYMTDVDLMPVNVMEFHITLSKKPSGHV